MASLVDEYAEELMGDTLNLNIREDENIESGDEQIQSGDEQNQSGDEQNQSGDEQNDKENENEDPDAESAKVEVKKRTVRNPQPKLNAERLKGPRGVHTLENYFKDFKFLGRGHEQTDLDRVMKRIEHWAHRLFPKYQFDDCLEKLETLGKKKPVMSYMVRYRQDMLMLDEPVLTEADPMAEEDVIAAPLDEFDELLDEQLAIARSGINQTRDSEFDALLQTPTRKGLTTAQTPRPSPALSTPFAPQKNTSTPISTKPYIPVTRGLTQEQKERMEMNRKRAQEKMLERKRHLEAASSSTTIPDEPAIVPESIATDPKNKVQALSSSTIAESEDITEDEIMELLQS